MKKNILILSAAVSLFSLTSCEDINDYTPSSSELIVSKMKANGTVVEFGTEHGYIKSVKVTSPSSTESYSFSEKQEIEPAVADDPNTPLVDETKPAVMGFKYTKIVDGVSEEATLKEELNLVGKTIGYSQAPTTPATGVGAKNHYAQYEFDAKGRVVAQRSVDQLNEPADWSAEKAITFVYDTNGNLTSFEDENVMVGNKGGDFKYDSKEDEKRESPFLNISNKLVLNILVDNDVISPVSTVDNPVSYTTKDANGKYVNVKVTKTGYIRTQDYPSYQNLSENKINGMDLGAIYYEYEFVDGSGSYGWDYVN